MWFDVNAALKEALEQYPEEQTKAPPPARVSASENSGTPVSPQLTGNPNDMANKIIDMLRECATLAEASEIITRHQSEIARIVEAEPARKAHIENYMRIRWMQAQAHRGKGGDA